MSVGDKFSKGCVHLVLRLDGSAMANTAAQNQNLSGAVSCVLLGIR
jgi:hypothetical protein